MSDILKFVSRHTENKWKSTTASDSQQSKHFSSALLCTKTWHHTLCHSSNLLQKRPCAHAGAWCQVCFACPPCTLTYTSPLPQAFAKYFLLHHFAKFKSTSSCLIHTLILYKFQKHTGALRIPLFLWKVLILLHFNLEKFMVSISSTTDICHVLCGYRLVTY